MQHAFNYIPEKGLHCLAKHLNCGVAQLYPMATFYKALSLKPKGKHIIKICNGTACHIRGSVNLATGLKRELGIDPGETTEDGLFSVEMVNCLGSCALAPVMLVDGTYHNKLKLEDVPGIVSATASRMLKKGRPAMTRTERILVCCGTGCIANGAYADVASALEEQIAAQGANAQVELKVCRTGCSGECREMPLVRLMPRDTMYYGVKPADAPAIITSLEGDPVAKLVSR